MRNCFSFLSASLLLLFSVNVRSQFGPLSGAAGGLSAPPSGPRFGGAMSKLFGEHTAFTAKMQMEIKEAGSTDVMSMPGKFSFLEGKTRFDIDLAESKGTKMPAQVAAQMKALGMGEVVMISRPDKKLAFVVYPGMQAYMESPLAEDEAASPGAKYKVETTELGKDSVNGQACVKNKVLITDEKGNKHEATVWNAAELRNFPVKMEYTEDGHNGTITYREIKFEKPSASSFDPPATFTRYTGVAEMLRGIMLKQFGFGGSGKE